MQRRSAETRLPGHDLFAAAQRHHEAGRLAEAEALYRRILAANPRHVGALHALGAAATRRGQPVAAEKWIGRALAVAPDHAEAHSNLGVALAAQGRIEDAIASFGRAVGLKPDYVEAHVNLGFALAMQNRTDEAVASYRHALALKPDHVDAHFKLGNALQAQDRLDEAVASFERVIALKPDYAGAHYNLGNALKARGRLEEAVASYRRATALKPDYVQAHNNLGNLLTHQGKLDEAAATFERALAVDADHAATHNNLGTTRLAQGRIEEAVASLERALALKPDYPGAHFNLALALLATGDFAKGLAEYEWRFRTDDMKPLPTVAAPPWDGRPAPGGTVLLQAEQGYGDAIQFIRYAPLVRARCGSVVLQCAAPLLRLLATAPGVDDVTPAIEPPAGIAAHAPLLSLMHHFATRLETIPASVPYLAADPARVGAFEARIGNAAGLKVGLVWSGSPGHKNDRNRSLALATLAPLLAVEGVSFFSLQKGEQAGEIAASGLAGSLVDLGPALADFADTAAAVSCLDLVIAVDTAVAHLAGALARPVWTLLPFAPDWRWLLEREDSPWYPTMRLYRQSACGEWGAVLDRVVTDLHRQAHDKASAPRTAASSSFAAAETFAEAMRQHQAGRLDEAEILLRRVLAADPGHVRAYYHLGLAAGRRGEYRTAESLFGRALALAPSYADARYNLGNALQAQGRLDEAVASYRRAVVLEPNAAEAHVGLASSLRALGRLPEAVASYRHALALKPDNAGAHHSLGVALAEQGLLEEAAASYRRTLELVPEHAEAHNNLGVALAAQGQLEEALASFGKALALRPDYAEAHVNLGFALTKQDRAEEAMASYRRAVALKPDYADAHFKLGNALNARGRLEEAVSCLERAIALKPDFAAACNNLGNALEAQGRLNEAMASYRRALAINPSYAGVHSNIGTTLRAQGRIEEAVASFRRALALNPDSAGAHFNLALALLLSGDFAQGMAEYEWRFKAKELKPLPTVAAPAWEGQPLPGGTLLLQAEQGFGDAIQFIRYAPLVRALCGRLVLQCAPPLARLLATAPGIDSVTVAAEPPAAVAAHAPLMSLMRLFGTRLETIPGSMPYLAADPARVGALQERIGTAPGLKIGLAWAGSPVHKDDRNRSLALAALAPLLAVEGVSFFSLQKGERAAEIAASGFAGRLVDLAPGLEDFADTAAAVSCLDLVIAVDTAVAHLAGALAKPVWTLLPFAPDWRWLLQREDSPWYPTMRLYRQPAPGAWDAVLQRVAADLHRQAQERSPALSDASSAAAEAFAEAMQQHQAGRRDEAEMLFRRVIAADADHVRASYHLGLAAGRRGQYQAAETLLRRAVALAPAYADAHYNLGQALQAQGRLEEAIASCRRAIALEPSAAEAHVALATALQAQGRPDEATASYRHALALRPDDAEAHMGLAKTLHAQRRLEEAVGSYRRVLALKPDHFEAHNNLGVALAGQDRVEEALASFERALALKPDYADAHNNLGTALSDQGRLDEAVVSYRRALALRPDLVAALSSLANVLRKQGRIDEAKGCVDRALAIDPDYAGAHNNLGVVLEAQGRAAEAVASYERAMALEPHNARAHFNLGMALMLTGEFVRGAAEYEWRWRAKGVPHLPRLAAPAWDGQPLPGQTLLLRVEQGFGDAIQFIRYAPLVRARCGRVVLQCATPLVRLLAAAPGIDEVTAAAEPPPGIAAHAPLLSLMHLFGTRLETIPASVPYLAADPARMETFEERIGAARGLKVGLVWAGSPVHKKDRERSLDQAALAPLLAVEGVSFFSLQKGEQAREIAASGLPGSLVDLGPALADFADTAAAVSCLDLVIAVDTAVAHLAGALGKPVWTLLPFAPDWRWLLEREDSPWYPTMRLYRQPAPGEWGAVLERVAADLHRRAREQASAPSDGSSAAAEAFAEAMRHHQAGRLDEAEILLRRVLAADPGHVRALYHLGTAAGRRGEYATAETLLGRAVALAPAFADACYGLGSALQAQDRLEEAVASYRHAVALAPNAAVAHMGLGGALQAQVRLDEARASFERAVACKPDHASAHVYLGNVLQAQHRFKEAAASFERAIALAPDDARAHYNLGNALQAQDCFEEAAASYRRALALEPDYAEAHNNLGNALNQQGRLEDAMASYERALAINPDHAIARNNRGNVLQAQGRIEDAVASFQSALALKPDYGGAHFNLALALLLTGDFAKGAAEYEWRFKAEVVPPLPAVAAPAWDGQPVPGETLLLQAEQGHGDAIQFIRYAPLVRARCGRLVLQCAAPLVRLLATAPGVDAVTASAEPPERVAAHAPLMSLMHLFGTGLETIPASVPYLAADPKRAAALRERIGAAPGLKIGLAWAGSPVHKNDRNRSLALATLAPLLAVEGVSFFSLQKGERAAEIAASGFAGRLVDLAPGLEDFADTAAAVSCLDLVISVDTAVAHLAGALAKPVWTLLPVAPDWRWLLQRKDSPWYPTMRLYRQPAPGAWDAVLQRVAADLRKQAQERSAALSGVSSAAAEAFAEAMQQHQAGRFDEAETLFGRALAADPGHVRALYYLGIGTGRRGDYRTAERLFGRALALAPAYADAHYNLGRSLQAQGRLEEAIASYRRAIALEPKAAEAHVGLADALRTQGQVDEAMASYRSAIACNPNHAEAHNDLGNLLQAQDRLEEAVTCFERAIALKPDYAGARYNLGNALNAQDRLEEAAASYRRAIDLEPNYVEAHNNLGNLLTQQGQLEEAAASFERALVLSPDNAAIHNNLGVALLLEGEFARGTAEYEWRFNAGDLKPLPSLAAPAWKGQPLPGQTLLLRAEQGFGDAIQFVRYATLARARCGRLVLQCAPPLARLLATVPGVDGVTTTAEPPAGIAAHAPLLSLMHLLGTRLETIPASVPYLAADPARVAAFQERVGSAPGLKIGLAWAGSPGHRKDRKRSLALAALAPLLAAEGASFFSLQKGERAGEIVTSGLAGRLVDLGPDLGDFADTAAAVSCLDLVISVDTAVAHLAGALAKPVWTLLPFAPDWRWLLDRDDSPWYPTMRLFRQSAPGDWDEVIRRAAVALSRHGEKPVSVPATRSSLLGAGATAFAEAIRHHQAGRLREAEALYRRILVAHPDHVGALHHLGVAAAQRGKYGASEQLIGRALALAPNQAEAQYNLGNTLEAMGRVAEAAASYRRALAVKPDYGEAHNNLGVMLQAQGRVDEALDSYERAVALQPGSAGAHYNLGMARLLIGDFDRGTAECEWRFQAEDGPRLARLQEPAWDGRPLPGKTLLLRAEQGFGDAIQFVRYAPLVRARCGRLLLQCAPPLVRLLATAPGVDEVIAGEQALPAIAAHASLMSLMHLFGTRLETVPAVVPYLAADPARAMAFQDRIGAAAGLKVGLVWAGNPNKKSDRYRSLGPAALAPLLEVEGVALFSLQKGARAEDVAASGLAERLVDLAPQLGDFADTAAAVSCLDLVISVDTAVAHLAGALAKPVWTLLPFAPDWRWLMDREESPWYPTMRLLRQPVPGDWASVIDTVVEDLHRAAPDGGGNRQVRSTPTDPRLVAPDGPGVDLGYS